MTPRGNVTSCARPCRPASGRAEAELERREREHAAELGRIEAAAEARAAALEEARADLRARAERAERELDQARGSQAGDTPVCGVTQRLARPGKTEGGQASAAGWVTVSARGRVAR